ncbi:MAG TPA: FkbM family methyltransferase [Caulobacteraceae bacterium]|nr:FkbM family methyltransferase [Caulobacteraceae bacterium]
MTDLALYDIALLQTAALVDLSSPEAKQRSALKLRDTFLRLLAHHPTEVVFEIGANEASFSQAARRRAKEAEVIAFEANPHVWERFKDRCARAGVDYQHLAVTEITGPVTFQLQTSRSGKPVPLTTGSNSLLKRVDHEATYSPVEVPGMRLDEFIATRGLGGRSVCAWIDVEGAIRQVLTGMGDRIDDVHMMLIEVENAPKWEGQWCWHDVLAYLRPRGFVPVLRDFEYTGQFNVLFLREEMLRELRVRIIVAEHLSALGRPDPDSAAD